MCLYFIPMLYTLLLKYNYKIEIMFLMCGFLINLMGNLGIFQLPIINQNKLTDKLLKNGI